MRLSGSFGESSWFAAHQNKNSATPSKKAEIVEALTSPIVETLPQLKKQEDLKQIRLNSYQVQRRKENHEQGFVKACTMPLMALAGTR
jgi:hypothetical protein